MKKVIMEPSDFDKILKSKIAAPNQLHEMEMESAKPFVWSAVYREIKGTNSLTWWHMAAAVMLFLVSFSVVLYYVQSAYNNQLILLSDKIDLLESDYKNQLAKLENQNEALNLKVANQEKQDSDKSLESPQIIEKLIYQTDTVFIRQVEYVQVEAEPKLVENSTKETESTIVLTNHQESDNKKYDEIIYPVGTRQSNNKNSEQVKLKISAFTARSN